MARRGGTLPGVEEPLPWNSVIYQLFAKRYIVDDPWGGEYSQLGRIFDGWYAHRLWLTRQIGAGVGRVDGQADECAERPQ